MTNLMKSVLGPFFGFLNDYKKLISLMIVLPGSNLIMEHYFFVGPEWPGPRRCIFFTSIVDFLVLTSIFTNFRGSTKKRMLKYLNIAVRFSFVAIVVYILLRSFFIYTIRPNQKDSFEVTTGLFIKREIRAVLSDDPTETIEHLLWGNHYDPTAIWEPWSVFLIRFIILLSWIVLNSLVALSSALFLLYQEKNISKIWGNDNNAR